MSKIDPWNELGSVVSGIADAAASAPKQRKLTVTSDGKPKQGWDSVPDRKLTRYQDKEVSQWNNNDVRWYFKDSYFKRYGTGGGSIPIALFNQNVSQILFTVGKRLGNEPPKAFFKDYIDYFFERFADAEIKARGSLAFWALTKERPLLMYLEYMGANRPKAVESEVVVEQVLLPQPSMLTNDLLITAYRVSPRDMLTQFGAVIPVNFLMAYKGKSLDESIGYVEKSLLKFADDDKKEMFAATARWGPYPAWLRFTAAEKFGASKVDVVTQNPVFDCLKETK
jgi:hypothetical protein